MDKAAWRLILNSIATTIFLTLLGEPILDVTAVIGMFGVFLWLQEEVIESITGRRLNREREFKKSPQRGGHDAAADG